MERAEDIAVFKMVLANASRNYHTFADFEHYVEELPDAEEKSYLILAREHMRRKLARGERFFLLDRLLIEEIVSNVA